MRHPLPLPLAAAFSFFSLAAYAQEPTPEPTPTPPAEPVPPVPPAPPDGAGGAPSDMPTDVPPESSGDNSPLAADGHPMSGWHNGLFYMRDYNDNFRLHVQGRAQIDTYTYFGQGVGDTNLKPTMFLRRIRPEVTGEFFHQWWFMIAGDFGATALDNPKGTTETSAASPGAAPNATSGRYASAQTAKISAQATDVYLAYAPHRLFAVQAGQFDAPFTMENRTSDKYFPWMERALAVRVVGIPTNKEIGGMVYGETADTLFHYEVGLFNGDGQSRLNTDSRGDVMSRVFFHPLAPFVSDPTLKTAQIGGSFRYGSRDKSYSSYDYNALTTQGNYTFWNPTYTGAGGFTHILPSGDQIGVAGELRIPISMFDLTSEFVYIKNNTREALEGYQATNTERFGDMSGYSYYVQLGFWPIGKRDVNGLPGYENQPHVDFKKPDPVTPPRALQLLAKWEQLALTYKSASRDGTPDLKNIDGDIKVNAFSLGANYWVTKHIRLTANYVLNMFPDSAPSSASAAGGPVWSATNRAQAPGNTLGKGVNDTARDNAQSVLELLFRFAFAL